VLDDIDKANGYEELRSAKNQQWAGATAAVTLLAAIYAASKDAALSLPEKIFVGLLIALIALSGVYFLVKLQTYMHQTRLDLNPHDKGARLRGVDVLAVLIGATVLSAIFVFYFLILRTPN
jgi:hypothetical protein